MKHTIRFLAVALCLLFARDVGARTLYVDARRPNNNGNGLSAKKAKKTIQAAINIAKKGDTIIVYSGTYAPIQTNNKKIAIKSKKGKSKTVIGAPAKTTKSVYLANLGKLQRKQVASGGTLVMRILPMTKGTKTVLAGFSIDGKSVCGYVVGVNDDDPGIAEELVGVSGGTLESCTVKNVGNDTSEDWNMCFAVVNSSLKKSLVQNCKVMTVMGDSISSCLIDNSKLTACKVVSNDGWIADTALLDCTIRTNSIAIETSTLHRCTMLENGIGAGNSTFYRCTMLENRIGAGNSTFSNCLVADNSGSDCLFSGSKFYNCTIVKNTVQYNANEHDGDNYVNALSKNSKYYNSICWNNRLLYSDIWSLYGAGNADGGTTWVREYVNSYTGLSWWWIDVSGYDLINHRDESGSIKLGSWEDEDVERETFAYTMRAEIDNSKYSLCNASNDGNTYKNTYTKKANPKFKNAAKGDYRLKKGSPCINKGKLTAAQKKLVGTKDLAGKKRVKGKSVDIGCYEY